MMSQRTHGTGGQCLLDPCQEHPDRDLGSAVNDGRGDNFPPHGADDAPDESKGAETVQATAPAALPIPTERGRVEAYVGLVERIHAMYRHIVMDTPEDRALHEHVVQQADQALSLIRAALDAGDDCPSLQRYVPGLRLPECESLKRDDDEEEGA